MARVTGIGGVFFRSEDPQALHEWYVEHLGLSPENPGFVVMSWGDVAGRPFGHHSLLIPTTSGQPTSGWSLPGGRSRWASRQAPRRGSSGR